MTSVFCGQKSKQWEKREAFAMGSEVRYNKINSVMARFCGSPWWERVVTERLRGTRQ